MAGLAFSDERNVTMVERCTQELEDLLEENRIIRERLITSYIPSVRQCVSNISWRDEDGNVSSREGILTSARNTIRGFRRECHQECSEPLVSSMYFKIEGFKEEKKLLNACNPTIGDALRHQQREHTRILRNIEEPRRGRRD